MTGDPERIEEVVRRVDSLVIPIEQVNDMHLHIVHVYVSYKYAHTYIHMYIMYLHKVQ